MRAARTLAVALAAGGLALGCSGAAMGATRTMTIEGWGPRAMAFSDRTLVWSEAATVRVDPRRIAGSPAGAQAFTYYRAEAFRARLDRTSRRFAGPEETLVSIRTSIASMIPGAFGALPGGGLVTAPYSPRFAAPVVACCSPEGDEIVIESDGRPDALPTVAAAWDGAAVRFVQLRPDGTQVLRRQDDPAPTGQSGPTRRGLVALAPDRRWWVDPAAPGALLSQDDSLPGAPVASVALPGTATGVWAAQGLAVVAVRSGARVSLLRIERGAVRRIWSGRRVPRVAVGGGGVVAADGRVVWAGRSGALRRVTTTRRPVEGVAVDGRRLAWAERGLRRGARVAVIRLAAMR